MNKVLVWALFIILTAMQMMGNTYYAYTQLENYQSWIELFGLIEEDPITQKRILAIISGSILPLIALGFIKSLVDYIKPEKEIKEIKSEINIPNESVIQEPSTELVLQPLEPIEQYVEPIVESTVEDQEMTEEEYREFIASPEGQELLKEIIAEQTQSETTDESDATELESRLESEINSQKELTPEDIERYKEMTKIKVGQSQRKKPLNPQILPGLNM